MLWSSSGDVYSCVLIVLLITIISNISNLFLPPPTMDLAVNQTQVLGTLNINISLFVVIDFVIRQTVWLSTAPTEPLTHWYQVSYTYKLFLLYNNSNNNLH